MEYILKKLRTLQQEESWLYAQGFSVKRIGVDWQIRKHGIEVVTSRNIDSIAKEIKLSFIAIEITKSIEGDA